MFSVRSCNSIIYSIRNQLSLSLVPPSIVDNGQMINEINILKGQSLVLTCSLHAIPLPTIIWTKNDQALLDSDRFHTLSFISISIDSSLFMKNFPQGS